MTVQQLLLLGSWLYLAFLVAAVYLTRATPRRVLGALAGGVAVAAAGVGVEALCQALGFWRYPADESGYGPALMYPLLVLMFAVLALLGWRVMRRFGWRGQVAFLAAVTALGTFRDYVVAGKALGVIALAPGVATVLVDAACWAGLTALAQGVMRVVAGPAAGDRLARRP
jgi:hypothetical protein